MLIVRYFNEYKFVIAEEILANILLASYSFFDLFDWLLRITRDNNKKIKAGKIKITK